RFKSTSLEARRFTLSAAFLFFCQPIDGFQKNLLEGFPLKSRNDLGPFVLLLVYANSDGRLLGCHADLLGA
ncbi:hypothetical protein, partial [Desulfovibrio sp. SGI.169]|uniref:hypothetical protein n=1 Tax=Desulfovibrio sp. SGI.169 TaxID=3420561 RepID=UPI003D02D0AA